MLRFCLALLLSALLIVPLWPGAVLAQDSAADEGRIVVELNNASDTETGACRLTFVAANHSGTGFEAASWQVGVFDGQGIVRSILVLEFGALAQGRTRIVLFDLPGRPCADISRVVVNDVAACRAQGGDALSPVCLDALTPRSRTAIAFDL
ncbi:MAG: hypothetical protein Q4G22_07440 [Paracoccus sp. (in: a-proteobacteria)]|uniref:hypothetical protein n=1 Tax=Paracoccus sp. TaxID=267 RepID=UPI0026DEE7C8|nr:hypothetical protein [Paracoccus sp. (in: a-proteobacteria)]MDO5631655.1 hypothetical protein [Paracoccus sp. (in: a-proteobacteria)]